MPVLIHVPGGDAGQLGELIATAFAEENAGDSEEQSAISASTPVAATTDPDPTGEGRRINSYTAPWYQLTVDR
jgi:hypothetical protein